LFLKVSDLINEIFDQPEKVTEKLITTVYTAKLAVKEKFTFILHHFFSRRSLTLANNWTRINIILI